MSNKKSDKSARIWYSKYIGDYARKTRHLSMAGHGAFNLLLDHYYQSEKPLPLEWVQLHRICSAVAPEEQATVQAVVQEFFNRTPDGWQNDRADQEIAKRKDISEKRRLAQAERERQRLANLAKMEAAGEENEDFGADEIAGATDPANDSAKGVQMHPQPQPHPQLVNKSPTPLNNPQSVNNVDKKNYFDIEPYLTDRHREEARAHAKGRAMSDLIRAYNEGVNNGKRRPPHKNPAAAFVAWVPLYVDNKKMGFGA